MSVNRFGFTTAKLSKLECKVDSNGNPKTTFFWDADVNYLGVRITANGVKSFIYECWFNGGNVRITIGKVSDWTIGQAKVEATRLKVLTDQGIDPRIEKAEKEVAHRAARIKGVSGLVVWDEYIKDRSRQWGDRHKAEHNDMVREGGELITRGLRQGQSNVKQPGILRGLLSQPLADIDREKVTPWLKKQIEERPTRAGLALRMLKSFLTWCNDQPKYQALVHADACDRLTRELPPKNAKDDCLQKEQLKPWFKEVKNIYSDTISTFLQCLLLTGARRGELATLKWADVDLKWKMATIRDKVEGTRTIPLTPYVAKLISDLPRDGEYVFASKTSKGGYISDPRKPHQIAIEKAEIPNLSIHGLRRSFGTLAEWVECPAGVSAQIMGHKPSAIAEKHYRARPIDLLRQWHSKIEKFILDQAGIAQPKEAKAKK